MDQDPIHINIHVPEGRVCFINNAEGLPGEIQGDGGSILLGRSKRTHVCLAIHNLRPVSGVSEGRVFIVVDHRL